MILADITNCLYIALAHGLAPLMPIWHAAKKNRLYSKNYRIYYKRYKLAGHIWAATINRDKTKFNIKSTTDNP